MSTFGSSTYEPSAATITVYPRQKAGSYSSVSSHRQCPLAFRFRKIDRLEEPPNPAFDRGTKMHADAAQYLTTGTLPERSEISDWWVAYFDKLRPHAPTCEKQIAFDKDWNVVPWFGAHVRWRIVMDAMHHVNPEVLAIHEWKSGGAYPEHHDQLGLYLLAGLKLHPKVKTVRAVIGYLDHDKISQWRTATREDEPKLDAWLNEFSREFFNDEHYPARPNRWCGRCWFRKSNNGKCAHG